MASSGSVADQQVAVSTELLQEARQYRTVQTVLQWPVVTNSTTAVLDGYHTFKKEGEVARVVLNASEDLAGVIGQFAVLPVVRSPLVQTPLKMADYVSSTGATLLQKAIPRLTDTKQPLQLNGELLLSLLMVPLTLSVALSRDLLQFTVDWLVSSFPGLSPAAEGFQEKSLFGQCVTVSLMVGLYLPLRLISQPVQTAITWVREAFAAVVAEVTLWTSWVGENVLQAVSWVAATAQTAYYVVFVMTGLEPLLESLLRWVRSLLQRSKDGANRAISSVSEAAPVSGLVRRMRSVLPARIWRRSDSCVSCGAAATPSAPKETSGRHGLAGTTRSTRTAPEQDLWAPRRVGGALLVTVSVCVAAVAAISLC